MFLIRKFFKNKEGTQKEWEKTVETPPYYGQSLFEINSNKIAIILLIFIFFITFYFLNRQIQQLTTTIKNLTIAMQSIESNQFYIRDQLILKDAQIKTLENLLIELHFSLSALSTPINNMPQNFELLRQEIVEINPKELNKFLEIAGGILISILLIYFVQHYYPFFREVFNVALLDSENNLVWDIKIMDNKIAEILVKDLNNPENYYILEGPAKVLIMKCSNTITSGSIENLEMTRVIGSYLPASEKTVIATQISEIIGSFFNFLY